MARNLQTIADAPIIELDTIDSTNNYAMQLIDADTAQVGLTIIAGEQTHGKGQRGKSWEDMPSQSLLMSIIVAPDRSLTQQFVFNAAIAVAVSNVLLSIYESWDIRIKWPNDIIINDKKAGGILIENVIRGDRWEYGVIGLGINVLQEHFPRYLPYATSLKEVSGKDFNIYELAGLLRKSILEYLYSNTTDDDIMTQYNNLLYRRGMPQAFSDGNNQWTGIINKVTPQGLLMVQLADGTMASYKHGSIMWRWE